MNEKEKSWYSNNANHEFSKDDLISLYKTYYGSLDVTLTHYHNIRNYYVIMLTALFGLFFTLLAEPSMRETFSLFFYLILIGIFVLAIIAYISTNRYYRVWLERVVMLSKIENLLGLDNAIKTKMGKPHKLLWNNDSEFMLHRYIEDRLSFKTSQDFIDNRMCKGDNMWSRITFILFILISGVSLFLIIFVYHPML